MVMVRLKMAESVREAATFVEQGHVRVGPNTVTDPAFHVTRNMEDFVTWVDTSKIKRKVGVGALWVVTTTVVEEGRGGSRTVPATWMSSSGSRAGLVARCGGGSFEGLAKRANRPMAEGGSS